MDINEIQKLIPHRHPFLMIDRVLEVKVGVSIKAQKNISIDEEYFKGHFPGNPIFPGVLTLEAMAQTACLLLKKSIPDITATIFYVTNIRMRFFKPIFPGDKLIVDVKALKMIHIGGVFETKALVNNDIVAKGEMTFACK